MCYSNIATIRCPTCKYTAGEKTTGTDKCDTTCGLFLSRKTGEFVDIECRVCEHKREESAAKAAALRAFSLKKGKESSKDDGDCG
jgi:hypothetical protein